MARKKSGEFHEEPDEAAMEGEVIGVTDDEAPTVEPTLGAKKDDELAVNLDKEKAKKPEPKLSPTTIAEQEAGRKALGGQATSKDET